MTHRHQLNIIRRLIMITSSDTCIDPWLHVPDVLTDF